MMKWRKGRTKSGHPALKGQTPQGVRLSIVANEKREEASIFAQESNGLLVKIGTGADVTDARERVEQAV